MNLSKYNTTIDVKKKNFKPFAELIENQFKFGGVKYQLNDQKEFTDQICETFPGETGVDWVLGTIMKYLGRYKTFGQEKDLLKSATYLYILWLKAGFHLEVKHNEDVIAPQTSVYKVVVGLTPERSPMLEFLAEKGVTKRKKWAEEFIVQRAAKTAKAELKKPLKVRAKHLKSNLPTKKRGK